jgi:hypothetical protein
MTRRLGPWFAAAAVSLATGCSCAAAHEPSDGGTATTDSDAAGMDGSVDAWADDAWERMDWGTADDGVCRPGQGLCQTDEDCVFWGMAVGPPGTFVSSFCANYHCTVGRVACRTHDGFTMCLCSDTTTCAFGEICVSDTEGGPTRCAQQCVAR